MNRHHRKYTPPQEIAVADEDIVVGFLGVSGSIPIEQDDGLVVETRYLVTLCRCGHPNNKPFCDEVHYEIGFVA
ncbi:MAG: CDGSH iron-sulfur domain-containing protein [Chloroflexota bacterium]